MTDSPEFHAYQKQVRDLAPELQRALRGCLVALDMAIQNSEGDLFGRNHNKVMDTIDFAEQVLAKAAGKV